MLAFRRFAGYYNEPSTALAKETFAGSGFLFALQIEGR
jgi:hypothetical protein